MPFNIYTFVLSEKLASDEFAKRGVSDKDSVRRTALITGFLSPADGGINGAVLPALFAKEKASRDAAATEAATVKPTQPTSTPQDTPKSGGPTLDERLTGLEAAFAPYESFVGKTVGAAKPELQKNFVVTVKDTTGTVVDAAPDTTKIEGQQPDPTGTPKLLKGALVSLIVKKV
jgi:hypothetical protein